MPAEKSQTKQHALLAFFEEILSSAGIDREITLALNELAKQDDFKEKRVSQVLGTLRTKGGQGAAIQAEHREP